MPSVPPKVYILKLLLKNLPDTSDKSDHCEEYFNLITHLMKQCSANFKLEVNSDVSTKTPLNRNFSADTDSFSASSLLKWCLYQLV